MFESWAFVHLAALAAAACWVVFAPTSSKATMDSGLLAYAPAMLAGGVSWVVCAFVRYLAHNRTAR